MTRLALAVVAGGVLTACAGPTASQCGALEAVRAELAFDEPRLVLVRAELAASEDKAARAKSKAEFEGCRATQASIQAEATIAVADCQRRSAEYAQCEARNESRTAETGVGGCVLGIFAAIVTGGAAAPLAAGGCAAGAVVGAARADDCPAAGCNADPAIAFNAAVARHGLMVFPVCGGELGITMGAPLAGGTISRLVPGGAAERAGLLPGDTVTSIDGRATPRGVDVAMVLNDRAALEIVRVDFLRAGRPFEVGAALTPRKR
jgi:PDZ domain